MPPILVSFTAKRIATQVLLMANLNGRQCFFERLYLWYQAFQQGIACSKIGTEAQK